MRFLAVAVCAASLLGGAAWAQTAATPALQAQAPADQVAPAVPVPPSRCGDAPAPPTLPENVVSQARAMQAAQVTMTEWDRAYRVVMECRLAEAQEARAVSDRRREEYNAAATQLNTTLDRWRAQVEQYNASAAGGRRRSN